MSRGLFNLTLYSIFKPLIIHYRLHLDLNTFMKMDFMLIALVVIDELDCLITDLLYHITCNLTNDFYTEFNRLDHHFQDSIDWI